MPRRARAAANLLAFAGKANWSVCPNMWQFAQPMGTHPASRSEAQMSSGRITNKARAAEHRQLSAQANGRAARLLPIIEKLHVVRITSMRGIAAALDQRGFLTARGGAWPPAHVQRLMERIRNYGRVTARLHSSPLEDAVTRNPCANSLKGVRTSSTDGRLCPRMRQLLADQGPHAHSSLIVRGR